MDQFLNRCKEKGIVLNKDKMECETDSITFMGHSITKDGIRADEEKIKALREFPSPRNTTELRSFIGIVNYLAKFTTNLT